MNDSLQKTIEDQIKQHLPQQIGEALQKELADFKTLRVQYEQLERINKENNKKIIILQEANTELEYSAKAVEKRSSDLDTKEAELKKREDKQSLLELELKLQTKFKDEIKELSLAFVRSPVVTRSISGSVPIPVEGNRGGNGGYSATSGFVSQGTISTMTTEEVK